MHLKMSSTGGLVDEISEFLLFTVTDGGHFGFYSLENSARLLKRGVGAYFFYKYLKLPKTTVKPYLHKVGHGIRVLDPTSSTVQGENTDRHYVFMSGNEIKSENRITNIVKHHRQTSSARAANNLPII